MSNVYFYATFECGYGKSGLQSFPTIYEISGSMPLETTISFQTCGSHYNRDIFGSSDKIHFMHEKRKIGLTISLGDGLPLTGP